MSPPNGTGNAGATAPDGRATVYDLASDCTLDDLEEGARYHGTVNGVMDYGVFVDVSEGVSGLVHSSNLIGEYEVGDEVVVELTEILADGDVSFSEIQLADFETEAVGHGADVAAADIADATGETVHVDGQVVQVKQTGGPTIFQIRGERAIVPCAAFEEAGVRAYPEVELDDIVRVTGTVESRDGAAQLEVDDITVHDEEDAEAVQAALERAANDLVSPADVELLADWPAFEKLRGDLEDVAKRLRRTVLEGRPIRMRHHADGDGLCASVPLQYALEQFIEEVYEDPDAARHLLKRLPSKAPFYEMEDVTRDLNFALEDRKRHGQKLPLLLMLDNGSTEEDTPAYRNLAHYDVPILVVDHHHPDPDAVEPLVDAHVNPYLHDEDYRIPKGLMCAPIEPMIAPDDCTPSVRRTRTRPRRRRAFGPLGG